MINSNDKGFFKEKVGPAPTSLSSIQGLPKYIAYKTALLREKMILSYVVAIIAALFAIYFIISRIEISNLNEKLRTKEFILAPGVQDFTPVLPQSIPDSYIHDAISDFLSSLGNINSSNIVEEYDGLKKFMSDEFRIKFEIETRKWIAEVISEDLAQILKVSRKQIVSNENGFYKITAFAKVDIFSAGQHLGNEDQVIEMEVKLTPPDRHKRWYLEITNLSWSKLENFKNKVEYQTKKAAQ